jgi:POT family proton-dependent oligopeptide transporter
MAVFLMSVSLGNFFTAGVNSVIQVGNQTAAAGDLVGMLFETDDDGELVVTTPEGLEALVTEARDLQDNPIRRELNEDGSFAIVLAGLDAAVDADDIRVEYDAEGSQTAILTAEQAILQRGTDVIIFYFFANEETLPTTEVGQALLADLQDSYETPLQYRLVNRNKFRLTSLGADREYMTPLDVVLITEISRPSGDAEANERPYSWREARIVELRGEEGRAEVERERGGIDAIEFAHTTMIGGQTNLEGADYFWFFTKLMFVTALIFVGVAFLYKPQEFLQEEGAGDGTKEGTQEPTEEGAA